MSATTTPRVYSVGALAAHFGVPTWKVRRLFSRKFLPEPAQRVGTARVVAEADLPAVREALVRAGYLREGGDHAA